MTACGARLSVHLQRGGGALRTRRTQRSLDASAEPDCRVSLELSTSSSAKFHRASRGISAPGMELSIGRFCCVLLGLFSGKFSVPGYFDPNGFFPLKRQRVSASAQPFTTTETCVFRSVKTLLYVVFPHDSILTHTWFSG